MKKFFPLCIVFISISYCLRAQNDTDLIKLVGGDSTSKEYVSGAFKSTRVIMGQSIEMINKGAMELRILHRFGYINSGFNQFFGWDQGAEMRFGLDFGISNNLTIGIARNSFDKEYEALIKWRPVRQGRGAGASPVSVVWVADFTVNTRKSSEFSITPVRLPAFTRIGTTTTQDVPNDYNFSDRWSVYTGVIVGSKISNKFSLQVTPEVVLHHNYALFPSASIDVNPEGVRDEVDHNNVFAVGVGARYKLSKRIALVVDYHHVFTDHPVNDGFTYRDPLAIGFDIETGGHVFQLHFSNSVGMNEKSFLTQTFDDFWKGDIRFGFNLSRMFGNKKGAKKNW